MHSIFWRYSFPHPISSFIQKYIQPKIEPIFGSSKQFLVCVILCSNIMTKTLHHYIVGYEAMRTEFLSSKLCFFHYCFFLTVAKTKTTIYPWQLVFDANRTHQFSVVKLGSFATWKNGSIFPVC